MSSLAGIRAVITTLYPSRLREDDTVWNPTIHKAVYRMCKFLSSGDPDLHQRSYLAAHTGEQRDGAPIIRIIRQLRFAYRDFQDFNLPEGSAPSSWTTLSIQEDISSLLPVGKLTHRTWRSSR